MKLPRNEISLQEKLAEFDLWITPSIQEIQDTQKYNSELEKVDSLIRNLGEATKNFSSTELCKPDEVASTCIKLIEKNIAPIEDNEDKTQIAIDTLESLFSLLFMVTGKSDNNLKCQFPVYLSQSAGRSEFPQKRGRGSNMEFRSMPLGRTIKSDKLSKLISDALINFNRAEKFRYLEQDARWLLGKYVAAILKDEESVTQFWALGRSYYNLLEMGSGAEKALLAPIIIFKIRGSVSASGGHIPEDILRDMMDQWGLESGTDYNLDDVILESQNDADVTKTRAYDFILPYMVEDWAPQIFIQCQFYAGDSGSVSHKVVDQTQASRPLTLAKYPHARFIEYLDGAGYYSSLNTDLQHMLGMNTTKNFIQVRSAHVKLRRELQNVGFLTPVEIEHAIFKSLRGDIEEVRELLAVDGYEENEIDRSLALSNGRNIISQRGERLFVLDSRVRFAQRLLVIDIVAQIGKVLNSSEECVGKVLIPGYGPIYGALLSELSIEIDRLTPNANYSRTEFAQDITWLTEKKFIILR